MARGNRSRGRHNAAGERAGVCWGSGEGDYWGGVQKCADWGTQSFPLTPLSSQLLLKVWLTMHCVTRPCQGVCVCERERERACLCVCVRERERERERESVCVCERERAFSCVCV